MKKAHTLVVGDTHGNWQSFLKILHTYTPKICLVAGDFGWWPSLWEKLEAKGRDKETLKFLEINIPNNCKVYFIDGNHEEFSRLLPLVRKKQNEMAGDRFTIVELGKNILYLPRGSLFTLADGRKVFCCGGGKSVDWKIRVPNVSWFQEEILLEDDLPKMLPKAEIVLSHTAPNVFGMKDFLPKLEKNTVWDLTPDPSCDVLDKVYCAIQPELWLASHFHMFRKGWFRKTKYVILNRSDLVYKDFSQYIYKLF